MSRLAPHLDDYSQKYRHVNLTRRDGVLEVRLHSDGDTLVWCPRVHEELGYCFTDIAHDPDNKVVIISGDGDAFCTELDQQAFIGGEATWAAVHLEGQRLINGLLGIEVPVIGVLNGPAHIHAEILLMSDVVIAANHATIQDPVHYSAGWVPGDGVHVFWPALLGPTRASYFQLMGETIDAHRAKELGLVNEVLDAGRLRDRAIEIAERFLQRPSLVNRYSRALFTHEMRGKMHAHLSHGLALEGMAYLDPAGQAR